MADYIFTFSINSYTFCMQRSLSSNMITISSKASLCVTDILNDSVNDQNREAENTCDTTGKH